MRPHLAVALSPGAWATAVLASLFIGLSKTGFSGISLLSTALMAGIMPARESVGVILPLLICADFFAVSSFRQHADWQQIRRILGPAIVGILAGALILRLFADVARYPDWAFKRVIGGIVIGLVALQTLRRGRPDWLAKLPAAGAPFTWSMGLIVGVTTMLANAAGPVATIYLMAAGLPKFAIVGTGAWIFLILNLVKVPFNYSLGVINADSLALNAYLFPAVAAGALVGRWLLGFVPQQVFDWMLLIFATAAAIKLVAS